MSEVRAKKKDLKEILKESTDTWKIYSSTVTEYLYFVTSYLWCGFDHIRDDFRFRYQPILASVITDAHCCLATEKQASSVTHYNVNIFTLFSDFHFTI